MKKNFKKLSVLFLPLGALFIFFATIASAQDTITTFLLEKPYSAKFYGHAIRPPEELDGPSIFDRHDFDKVFLGYDKLAGTTSDGARVFADIKTGCFYKKNDSENLYHLDLLGGGTDSYYGFTPSISWDDGSLSDIPYIYRPFFYGKCSDVKSKKIIKRNLIMTGKITGANLDVYEPKTPLKSRELKKLYRESVFAENKPSFEDFVKLHPLIYVDDGLGLMHRLLNTQFAPAGEMGKPVLYIYPEKETQFTVGVTPIGGKITEQIPALHDNTWHVDAKPSGELTVDGHSYPYLYYESTTNQPMPLEKGIVVAREDLANTLENMLDTIGFKQNEKSEFLAYWLPRMNSKPYYAIQFLFNDEVDRYSQLTLSPSLPIYRVFMNFQGLSKKIRLPEQIMPVLDRSIPHAFEWGGNNRAQ